MANQSKLLDDEVVLAAKNALKTIGKNALLARKLEAIIAAKKHGIASVAKIYDISRTTLTNWIKHVKNNEFQKLQAPPERKRKPKINEDQKAQMKTWITNNPQLTLKEMRIKLAIECGLIVSKSTVQREIKKMNFSYITPRPEHAKQDKKKIEEFKKKYS